MAVVRRLCLFIVLAIVASACATHIVSQTTPAVRDGYEHESAAQEETQSRFDSSTLVPVISSCWDPILRSYDRQEWFDGKYACLPVVIVITDVAKNPSQTICEAVLMPGEGRKQMGPATWTHFVKAPDGRELSSWVVTATAYYSYVSDDRSEGKVAILPIELSHVRNYGWYIKTICPQ